MTAAWLRTVTPAPPGAVRLVCCPHAGGTTAVFRDWAGGLGPGIGIVAVQYPGRADRIAEPPLTDLDTLVDGLLAALAPLAGEPLALFGHSLGALVAWETARRMPRPPVHLVVSGRGGPQHAARTGLHRGTDADLVGELERLGGTPTALLNDPEVAAVLLPAVRADYRVSETYRPRDVAGPVCPATVVVGDADPEIGPGQVAGWAEAIGGPTRVHVLPGDHFYLVPRRDQLLMLIRRALAGVIAPVHLPAPP